VKSCTRCGAAFSGEGEICPHCRREEAEAERWTPPLDDVDLARVAAAAAAATERRGDAGSDGHDGGPPGGATAHMAAQAGPAGGPGSAAPAGGGHGDAPGGDAGDTVDTPDSDDAEGVSRRRFLTNTALTVGGVVGVGYLALGLRYLFPNVSAAATPLQDVGPLSNFPAMSPTLTTIVQDGVQDGVYVVNLAQSGTPGPGQLLALDFHCTHLNCPVTWYPGVNGVGRYICPCHGSQFTIVGDHVAGPAPRPMFRHQVVLKNGRVLVGGIIS
jgi:cytochrome b6-f complex iron-sulfur subunit